MSFSLSRALSLVATTALLAGSLSAGGGGGVVSLATSPAAPLGIGDDTTFIIDGTPGDLPFLILSPNPGPIVVPFAGQLDVGTPFYVVNLPIFPPSGRLEQFCPLNCDYASIAPFYAQIVSITLTNPLTLAGKSQAVMLDVDPSLETAPVSTCDTGCWRLENTPTPMLGPPGYGLRLGGLFGDGESAQYTFDFERPGAEVTLCHDADAGTITIEGLAYGGLDVGNAWDPQVESWVEIEMTYSGAVCFNGDAVVPISGTGSGSIKWLATDQTAPLVPKLRAHDQVYSSWETNGGVYPVFHGWLHSGTFTDPTLTGFQGDFESFAVGLPKCP